MLQLIFWIVCMEVTIVLVLSVTHLATLAVVEHPACLLLRIVKHLQFVKWITDIFTVIVHLVVFKESLVLSIYNCLFIVARVASLRQLSSCWWAKNNWPEKLEDALLHLLDCHFFVQNYDSWLGNRLLLFKDHVAWLLLSNHQLKRHKLTGVFIVVFSLKCNKLETWAKITDLKVTFCHHLNL